MKPEVSRNWDLGLDYDRTYREILARLEEYRGKRTATGRRSLAYTAVLLIQLRNGSRVSEAAEAALKWAETRLREVEVRVRKQRRHPETRLMIIPKQLSEQDRLDVLTQRHWLEGDLSRIEHFARRVFGWNTHSLRYAKISQLGTLGYPAQVIARITHHKRMEFILRYTSQKTADDILKKIE
jgi:Phage integrase family.